MSAPDWNAEMGTSGNMSMTAVALASAAGQIPYATGANALAMLAVGASGRVLTSSGTAPQWSTPIASVGLTTRGDILTVDATPAAKRLAVGAANTVLASDGSDPSWTGAPTLATSLTVGVNASTTGVQLILNGTSGSNRSVSLRQAGIEVLALSAASDGNSYLDYQGTLNLRTTNAGAYTNIGSISSAGLLTLVSNLALPNNSDVRSKTAGGTVRQLLYASSTDYVTIGDSASWAGINFLPGRALAWQMTSSGHLITGTDNQVDIGANGATRPRNLYVAGIGVIDGTVTMHGNASVGGTFGVTSYVSFGSSAADQRTVYVSRATSDGSGNNASAIYVASTLSKTGGAGATLAGYESFMAFSVSASITCTRAAQILVGSLTATVTGTLDNHNALYLGTPTNGTTVRVIDTASGAYLTTGGIWTNNPSWDRYKVDKKPLARATVRGWLDWMAVNHTPAFYRHDGRPLDDGREDTPRPIHQDYEHDTLFFSLDHWPDDMREAITVDPQGGIGTKDTDGLLLALVAEQAARHNELQAELGALRAELNHRRN